MDQFDPLHRYLSDLAEACKLVGAQVAVGLDNKILYSFALGFDSAGNSVVEETAFRSTCATKPLVSVALFRAHEQGIVDVDAPISLFVDQLKNHPSGLGHVPATALLSHKNILPESARLSRGLRATGSLAAEVLNWSGQEATPSVHRRYNRMWAWHVLGVLLECATEQAIDDAVKSLVTKPLGMRSTGYFAPECGRDDTLGLGLLRCTSDGVLPVQLAPQRLPVGTPCRPEVGVDGYTSAVDLVRLYMSLSDSANADRLLGSTTIARMVSPNSESRDGIQRAGCDQTCACGDFGLGFQSPLRNSGRLSSQYGNGTFGHCGHISNQPVALGCHDPESGISCAVLVNSVRPHQELFMRRVTRLVRSGIEHS